MIKPLAGLSLVLPLDGITRSHNSLVGGKAANLAVLIQAGLPVPPGFCVTTAAFHHFLASSARSEELLGLLARLSGDRIDQVTALSQLTCACLSEAKVPDDVAQAVIQAWRTQGENRRYAVRSSAIVEDAKDRSFAGQFESVLNVAGPDALLAALKKCWLSLFSVRALAYWTRHGLAVENVAMAVVVQEMIPADRSGVVFTADPLTGQTDRLVVEWVLGSGEALVQGTVHPARIILERGSRELQDGASLPERFFPRLLELAFRTERLFGAPQDIEWAERGGEVSLLQSRPISGPRRQPDGGCDIWSNLNVVENLPHVVTPLAWFILNYGVSLAKPLLKMATLDLAKEPWLGLVAGRVYINIRAFLRVIEAIPGLRSNQLAWLFGGHQDAVPEVLQEQVRMKAGVGGRSWAARVRALYLLARMALWFTWRASWRSSAFCLARFRAYVGRMGRLDVRNLSEDQLGSQLTAIAESLPKEVALPLSFGAGIGFQMFLRQVCARWFEDETGTLANQLLSRAGDMASAEAALALGRLAVWTSEQAAIREAVRDAQSYAALAGTLASNQAGREFLGRWDRFMSEHGHHAHGEVDVAIPRWSETPDEVLRWLQSYLNTAQPLDLFRVLDQRTKERERRWADCKARLRNPCKRWLLSFLVRRAQAWVVFRENFKNESVRFLGVIRRLFLELGDRLTQRGTLKDPEDIFFLTPDEMEFFWTGNAASDHAAVLIQARREAFRRNQSITPPPVVVGTFDPARHLPPQADSGLRELKGLPVSAGVATGWARVLLRPDGGEPVLPGEILVAPFTDPSWTPLFLTAAGLVTDLGGQLSHGSVIAREYGLPAVVNVPGATQVLRTGQMIRVDADRGVVTILAATEAADQ